MEFMDYPGAPNGSHDAAEEYAVAAGPAAVQHYASYADPSKQQPYMNGYNSGAISCDIKPRLTKEQHDILEAHFQKQNKPNTNTKKGFADTLNVSLDKVNNWFQNRRAKLKQDAKKQQGSLNLYHGNQHASSDTETSPGYVDTASQYHAMMNHWSTEQRAPNGLGISHQQNGQSQVSAEMLALQGMNPPPGSFGGYDGSLQNNGSMFGNQEELNRRTLTQEQFDAMGVNGGVAPGYVMYQDVATTFNSDQAAMHAAFSGYGDFKQQQGVGNYPIGAPMTSYDSTIPSNISAESLPMFPSSSHMQPYANMSSSNSDWSDSRSSSVHEATIAQHQPSATSQWQPGQSVPVDATQQQEEFRQVAARAGHTRPTPQHTWSEDSLARRGSSASLVQSMGDIGIQTPPQPPGTFKSPLPPANIAARRQRPRPAALGTAALRSQSHSGLVPQESPSQVQPAQFNLPDQPLRRIRSSNFLGNMAHGRVMKSTPSSAQRSPLNMSFAEAINSPHAMRHASASLAPPTPLSPKEQTEASDANSMQQWQSIYGAQHASIAETEAEHAPSFQAMAGVPANTWSSSPPVTPMYHQNHFVQNRIHGHPMIENTPPQSAPASQTCFSNVFAVPQHPRPAPPPQAQFQLMPARPPVLQQQAAVVQQPQMVTSEVKYQVPNYAFAPSQTMTVPVPSTPQRDLLQFTHGVPIADANGNIDFIFPSTPATLPSQPQFIPHSQSTPPHQHMQTPPQVAFPFVASSTVSSPSSQSQTNGISKKSPDFFVHEYTPPESVKRAATPRKGPADSVPKNYAFANTGPEHFEEKKGKKSDSSIHSSASSSTSPVSSSGTALTSMF